MTSVTILLNLFWLYLVAQGLVLFGLARWGKRVDDHPWCRNCRFDLFGLSKPTRCPECGADLSRSESVRIGQRRRRPWLMVVAIILMLAGIVPFSISTTTWARSYDWNRVKPVFWLRWEVDSADTASTDAALRELARRVPLERLDKDEVREFVDRGLKVQADQNVTWIPGWGAIIEAANATGLLSADEERQYYTNAIDPVLGYASSIETGGPLDLVLDFAKPRLSDTGQVIARITLTLIDIDDRDPVVLADAAIGSIDRISPLKINHAITIDGLTGSATFEAHWRIELLRSVDWEEQPWHSFTIKRQGEVGVSDAPSDEQGGDGR